MITTKTDANGRIISKTFDTEAELSAELWKELQAAYAENDRLRAELQKHREGR